MKNHILSITFIIIFLTLIFTETKSNIKNIDLVYQQSYIIKDTVNDIKLDVFPNPVNDFATIKFYIPDNEKINISLYNLLGSEIQNITNDFYNEGYHYIKHSFSDLPIGIYYIKIEGKHYRKTVKIIK